MSAYVESKEHFDVLIRAGLELPRPHGPLRWYVVDPSEIGRTEPGEMLPTGGDYFRALEAARRELTWETADCVGQILVNENVASVSHRYNSDPVKDDLPGPADASYLLPYHYKDPGYLMTPVETLMAIRGLRYQSCEHPQWERSEAARFLEALEDAAIGKLPGMDAAPWSWSLSTLFLAKREAIGLLR